jgi:hypothetical protein
MGLTPTLAKKMNIGKRITRRIIPSPWDFD